MTDYFKGKTAIVTGAGSGIGLATAKLLSQRGANVILAGRSAGKLEKAAREMAHAAAVAADITKPEDVKNLVNKTLERFGKIDILVNNAGMLIHKLMEETSPQEVREVMEVNYFAAVGMTNAVLPVMIKQGGGTIVNISSIAGRIGFPNLGYYCASKFALTGFTESLRQEVASKNIHVVLVSPGTIYTPMNKEILDEAAAKGKRVVIVMPERVAEAIAKGIEKKRSEVFIPWQTRVLNHLHFHFPGFAEWLAGRFRASGQN